jgi:hypothetical protein
MPYSKVNTLSIKDGIVVGEFVNEEKEEFTEKYYDLVKKVKP